MLMKKNMNTNVKILFCALLLGISLDAKEVSLGSISVSAQSEEQYLSDKSSQKTKDVAKRSKGETLGDYIEDEQFVDSASYGPAVGRPVIKGMDGYRVGIANGNIILNDLSAMSQDHAVGVMPRASQRIEVIKGPSSLLYGSYSGGVVHVLGEEHEHDLLDQGYSLDIDSQYGTNGAGYSAGAALKMSEYNLSVFASSFYTDGEDYNDGSGAKVKNSDTMSLQSHIVFGYQHNKQNTIKLYADNLQKEYGIPNSTTERTSIDMQQDTVGLIWHNKELFEGLDRFQTEIRYSDYLHYEYEADSADGLFGQKQFAISTHLDFAVDEWILEVHAQYLDSELQVCHEHGKCIEFYDAARGEEVAGSAVVEDAGLYYFHGHPMPNTYEKTSQLGVNLTRFLDDETEFATTLRFEHRFLEADNRNIDEAWLVTSDVDADFYDNEKDIAISLSTGITGSFTDNLAYQVSVAYIERLPSASEIFWNGFHHATDSYIMGNRDLDNEESINLDFSFMFQTNNFTSVLGGFYYDFKNYIYQNPLADENGTIITDKIGHGADVWQIKDVWARVYGVALKESYKKQYQAHQLSSTLSLEAIRGVLKDGGDIPRMSPYNATLDLQHKYNNLSTTLKYKYVDKSRHEAKNETSTPAYSWLSLYMQYENDYKYGSYSIYFKGENLTDELAYNHLSFLKDTAPLPGRQFTLGANLKF
jgi:iron complex outermembrane receptor protein